MREKMKTKLLTICLLLFSSQVFADNPYFSEDELEVDIDKIETLSDEEIKQMYVPKIKEKRAWESRDKFISDFEKYVGHKKEFISNTLVVYVKNISNPFKKKNDFANEYHPMYINGQSCAELGINFIEVRNYPSNKKLSKISCKD